MPKPTAPTDEIFPGYTDLADNWRAVDAHWLRDRVVQIYDDTAERTSVLDPTSGPQAGQHLAIQGMLSYLKGIKSLEFCTGNSPGSQWESVRYPNLTVTSDSTTVTMKQKDAGAGLTFRSDGSVAAATIVVADPVASGGLKLDATGLVVKTGTKIAKLTTDGTSLVSDSPVTVTGGVTASGQVQGATLNVTGNSTMVGTLSVTGNTSLSTLSTSGLASPSSLLVGGNAQVTGTTSLATFRHNTAQSYQLTFDNTGAAVITGTTVAITGALTINSASTFVGAIDAKGSALFETRPNIQTAGNTSTGVAGVVVSTSAPVQGTDNRPDGTIWIQV